MHLWLDDGDGARRGLRNGSHFAGDGRLADHAARMERPVGNAATGARQEFRETGFGREPQQGLEGGATVEYQRPHDVDIAQLQRRLRMDGTRGRQHDLRIGRCREDRNSRDLVVVEPGEERRIDDREPFEGVESAPSPEQWMLGGRHDRRGLDGRSRDERRVLPGIERQDHRGRRWRPEEALQVDVDSRDQDARQRARSIGSPPALPSVSLIVSTIAPRTPASRMDVTHVARKDGFWADLDEDAWIRLP